MIPTKLMRQSSRVTQHIWPSSCLSTDASYDTNSFKPKLHKFTDSFNTAVVKENIFKMYGQQRQMIRKKSNFLGNLLMTHPQLADFDDEKVVKYLEYMSAFGFKIPKAAELLLKYPPVLDDYNSSVVASLKSWQSLGFSERQQRKILVRHPQLLTFPHKSIASRSAFLKSYFTIDELHKIIENNMSVIYDHKDIVHKKLEYLIKRGSHTTESISKSTAVSHPLAKIITRHEFLIRAGLFDSIPYQKLFKVLEKINQKVSTAPGGKKFREKYFNPDEVVCLKDSIFVKVCTNNLLSVNELAAFEEAYAAETDNFENTEFDFNSTEDDKEDYDMEKEDNDPNDTVSSSNNIIFNSTGYFTDLEDKDFYY